MLWMVCILILRKMHGRKISRTSRVCCSYEDPHPRCRVEKDKPQSPGELQHSWLPRVRPAALGRTLQERSLRGQGK